MFEYTIDFAKIRKRFGFYKKKEGKLHVIPFFNELLSFMYPPSPNTHHPTPNTHHLTPNT